MLQRFYAVTQTSIYMVDAHTSETDLNPIARKIALRGESKIPEGSTLGGGMMIAITTQLQAYIPEGGGLGKFERQIEQVNTRYWGGHSSPLVALFFTEKEAVECYSYHDLLVCDERWLAQTLCVLSEIGDSHPTIYVCKFPGLSLIEY